MFIADGLPPKDLNSRGVHAFGLVWCRSSTNLQADKDLVREFIKAKGWNPPPMSYVHPVLEVVAVGWEDPTALDTVLLHCAYSGCHVVVVPNFRHLPDGGSIVRGVITIVCATTGEVMARRSHEAQLRRIAGVDDAAPLSGVPDAENQP
ncbi:hypothetical protein ACFXG4_23745 [Nocardia sp. NPDC059246]|uniref:hypothetical protein n=1 Tax=unclassified Nocardia TaxID=2637762 RepID=UPI0036B342BA